jgi:LAO/AO transport system kinase
MTTNITPPENGLTRLVDKMLQGETQALSRLINLVERDGPETAEIIRMISSYGGAHLVGITGTPREAAISTLVISFRVARGRGRSIGVFAVDPTSPSRAERILGYGSG